MEGLMINAANSLSMQGIDTSKLLSNIDKTKSEGIGSGESFGSIFQSYIDMFNQTNDLQVGAEQMQLDYASGKTDDMLAVILAQEKAYTSLNFTVQVTNKIIEAYKEIIRIQV